MTIEKDGEFKKHTPYIRYLLSHLQVLCNSISVFLNFLTCLFLSQIDHRY